MSFNKKNSGFFIFFLVVLSLSLVSSVWYNPLTWFGSSDSSVESTDPQTASIVNQEGWEVKIATGLEAQLTFWTQNNSKKTELGWIPPNNADHIYTIAEINYL